MSKTTRQPNLYWRREDLKANGFLEAVQGDGWEFMGIHVPPKTLRAWLALFDGLISPEMYEAIRAAHPIFIRLRKGDAEVSLVWEGNETGTCPPDTCP